MIWVSRIKYFKLVAVPAIKLRAGATSSLPRQQSSMLMRTSRTLASAPAYRGGGNRCPRRPFADKAAQS
jgi:hypothetical protein